MQYTRLGSSGLKVSRIALGTMGFGDGSREKWALDYEAAGRCSGRPSTSASRSGTPPTSTASAAPRPSSAGPSTNLARRDDIILATKVHQTVHEGPGGSGLSRKAIMEQIDASLTRLGTDYVDLYQIHRFDPDTPVEETMEALHDVVKAGKARYLGASSMWAWQFAKMQHAADIHGWTRFVSMQNQYSLVQREEEREMFGLLADQGVGSMPWSPLAGGSSPDPGETDHRPREAEQRHRLQREPAVARQRQGHRRRHRSDRAGPWRVHGPDSPGLGAEATRSLTRPSSAPPSPTTWRTPSPHSTSSSPTTRSVPSRRPTSHGSPRGSDSTSPQRPRSHHQ